MEKVLCLNCNKPVEITAGEGFYRCECGTLNSRTAMIDMLMLKQHNCKKSGLIERSGYRLINRSTGKGDKIFWQNSIKKETYMLTKN